LCAFCLAFLAWRLLPSDRSSPLCASSATALGSGTAGWCLTIHSSRSRFAARLNSGVRWVRGVIATAEQERRCHASCSASHAKSAVIWPSATLSSRRQRLVHTAEQQQRPARSGIRASGRLSTWPAHSSLLPLTGQSLWLSGRVRSLGRGRVAVPHVTRLTIHSSRSRFAARLNSGVRPQAKQSVRSGFSRVPVFRLRSLIPSASFSWRASIIPWMRAQIPTPDSSRALQLILGVRP